MGLPSAAKTLLDLGRNPQFLMPGLGTYLFDYVRSELESLAGLVFPKMTY